MAMVVDDAWMVCSHCSWAAWYGRGEEGFVALEIRNEAAAMKEVSDSGESDGSHGQHGRRNEKDKQYVLR
jgi:hypothetical protein